MINFVSLQKKKKVIMDTKNKNLSKAKINEKRNVVKQIG